MKPLAALLSILAASTALAASDPGQAAAEMSKYESGASVETLRQLERSVGESAGDTSKRAGLEAALAQLLDASTTFEAKRFACTQLAIIGTDASLPAIAKLLENPETTGIGCLALSSNPSPKVNELLRAVLNKAAGPARIQIIVMLGDRGDEAAVKKLCDLSKDGDAATASAAISSLGKIAGSEALAQLAVLRKEAPPGLAYATAAASLAAADKAARHGGRAEAASIFTQLGQDAALPVNIRRAAFEGLLRTDEDEGEKRALAALAGSDAALKTPAIVHVRRMKSPEASAKFARQMAALSPAEQVLMIESLAIRNDAAARAAIGSQLIAGDPAVRRAAVLAVAGYGDAKSAPMLAMALKITVAPSEQQTIEQAIASLKGGEAVDAEILNLLKNDESAPRAGLINALARRGSRSAAPAVLAEAGSPNPVVAKAAFRALGKLAGAGDLPALLERLAGVKSGDVRPEAESAAAKILSSMEDPGRRFAAVSEVLSKCSDADARCSLLGLLPACGDKQALAAAKNALDDKEPRVREAACRALANWPDAAAVDTLLSLAQSAPQPTERTLALRGAVRLLGSFELPAKETAARFQTALAAAKSNDEKKLVLGGLANVHDPASLGLIKPLLMDPAVQAEAAHAVVSLAPYLCGVSRDDIRSPLQTVIDQSMDKNLIQTARDLVETMNKFDDFIVAWQVSEPFAQDGKDGKALFDVVFPPEQPDAANVKWQLMPAGVRKDRPWMLDLGKLHGGDNRVAYARTWLVSDSAQPARLEFGSDDGIKAWLNGKVVHAANRGGDVVPGDQKADVVLQQGSNELLLKVVQWTSGWGFCARLAKPDGTPIQGVRIEVNPAK